MNLTRISKCASSAAKLAAVVLMVGLGREALAGITYFAGNTMQAELRGDQVVPVANTSAIGAATFVIDRTANTLTYRMVVTGLTGAETAATINGPANPGQNGVAVHTLPAGIVKAGVWNYPQALEGDLINGRLYVLIKTAGFPNGQVRGQIGDFVSTLTGSQAVPVASTTAKGWGTFSLNRQTRTIKYYISFSGLTGTETSANIGIGALHGDPFFEASVNLAAGSPKVGQFTYTAEQDFHCLNGRMFVVIKSTAFPAGEIRGQICPLIVPIDGQQEVPPVATNAIGIAHLTPCTHCNGISYFIQSFGLSSPEVATQVHGYVPPGQNGPIQGAALVTGNPKQGFWSWGTEQANVLAGLAYINIRTTGNNNGEIRGQIFPGAFPTSCPSDLNNDGVVDGLDIGNLLAAWSIPATAPGCGGATPCYADLNGDTRVDGLDVGIMLGSWSIPAGVPGCGN